jgi:hypothetical protein
MSRDDPNIERLGRLPPDEKVSIAIDMTHACLRSSIEGVRSQNPGIGDEELIEKLRERLEWAKRQQRRG